MIYNGTYTLRLPDGRHRTFRIYTKGRQARFAAGQRLIAILMGPDNTADYEPFGFVTDTGIRVWNRLKGQDSPSRYEVYADLLWRLAAGEYEEGYDLEIARYCLVCNRLLTDPKSIELGIGPVCRGDA